MRACPICKTSMTSKVLTTGGPRVEIDECKKDGLWFDGGQLERVMSRPVFDVGVLAKATPPTRCSRCGYNHEHPAPYCELCGSTVGLSCVSCSGRLCRLDAGGISLDICPCCR